MSRGSFIRMRGVWDTRHWIKIPGLKQEQQETLEAELFGMEGVTAVSIYLNRGKIRVSYDQRAIDIRALLSKLDALGKPAAADWWSSKKWAWIQYLDETAGENANALPANCCSKPEGINKPR